MYLHGIINPGVNLAQIDRIVTSYPNENELLQGCNVGAGYKSKQGVINIDSADNAETPWGMSEEEIEAQIMGAVLIENLNMKKGINILGKGTRLQ